MTLLQKIELTVCLIALHAFGLLGCTNLTPAQQAKADKFECQVQALAPLVEPALDAAELVRDLYLGKGDLGRALGSLGASQAELKALLERLDACDPQLPAGEPR